MKKEINKKYQDIRLDLISGKSLNQISKDWKLDIGAIRYGLKKRYPDDFDVLVHGIIIEKRDGFDLRKIPHGQTDRSETNITKKAKDILKKYYPYSIEEVGVWNHNFTVRYVVDLWSSENDIGFELCYSVTTSKKVIKKLNQYKKYFSKVVCVLLKDSTRFNIKKNRSYHYLKENIRSAGFDVIILDIGENTLTYLDTPISNGDDKLE